MIPEASSAALAAQLLVHITRPSEAAIPAPESDHAAEPVLVPG